MNIGWNWKLKLIIEKIEWTNVETKCHEKMGSSHNKLSRAPPDLDMFPMVKRRDFKTINLKMQAVNSGDILITCNIIRYIRRWWNFFDNASKQLAMKTMYMYGGCS